MLKKAVFILFILIFCNTIKGFAQVPLFIELEDTTSITIDTAKYSQTKSKLINKSTQNITTSTFKGNSRTNTRIDSLVIIAHQYMGNRYRRGGATTAGFDCSGYTMTVFKQLNIKLPHTSAGQGLIGITINQQNIQKGDLILFRGGNRRSRRIGHVGIVITEKGEPVRFIHSSTSEGVRIDNLNASYYRNRYVKSVRIPELYR
jgi:cell wall-associated NlpC family hydrolase